MKLRVTIDLDQDRDTMDELGSVEHGVYGVNKDGVYHMWYGNPSYLVEFKDVEELK